MMILDYYPARSSTQQHAAARSSTQQQQHIDLDSTDLFSFLIDFIDFIDFIDLIDLMHGSAPVGSARLAHAQRTSLPRRAARPPASE
ncbi:hypothetical protein H9P43_008858 [Blastocladiella emersonii ATCC 22665]|nr:hypothetical protein H9P43_008858 [Blastocladiella emersonii ATCC 22665]